ncbi:helix-turn-helix domain-containing protein [Enterobacter sichuanensis]
MSLIQQGLPFKAVSEKIGISRPTYFRQKRRFTAENKEVLSVM